MGNTDTPWYPADGGKASANNRQFLPDRIGSTLFPGFSSGTAPQTGAMPGLVQSRSGVWLRSDILLLRYIGGGADIRIVSWSAHPPKRDRSARSVDAFAPASPSNGWQGIQVPPPSIFFHFIRGLTYSFHIASLLVFFTFCLYSSHTMSSSMYSL